MGNTDEAINNSVWKRFWKNPRSFEFVAYYRESIYTKMDKASKWISKNRRISISILAFCLIVFGLSAFIAENYTSYEYSYYGEVLGTVKQKSDVKAVLDLVSDQLVGERNVDLLLRINKDITFDRKVGSTQPTDSKEQVLQKLTSYDGIKARGCIIAVNGTRKILTESEETALQALDSVKRRFMDSDPSTVYEKVGFAEDVSLINVIANLSDLRSREETQAYLSGAAQAPVHYGSVQTVGSPGGKSSFFWATVYAHEAYSAKTEGLKIPQPYGDGAIPVSKDAGAPKFSDLEDVSEPLLNVIFTKLVTLPEEVDFGITYEETDALYEGETEVKSEGVKGMNEIKTRIFLLNGEEVSHAILSTAAMREPINQVVLVGTKERPKGTASGFFANPARGKLSSQYGARWGRQHTGIDIAAPEGTSITAADGGIVTFSAFNNGGYGNLVIIDHGDGKETYYGHCSQLLVSEGDAVEQGEEIALVGNTGRSTGNHLHFEVRISGVPKNPLQYVSY